MKATEQNPTMLFVEYKIHRTSDWKIQFDSALELTKLNPEWKEGDVLGLSVQDGRVTLTKL